MKRKIIYISVVVVVILAAVLGWHFAVMEKPKQREGTQQDVAPASPWTWKNPYTSKQANIPVGWRKVDNEHLKDAVLALEHESGKCLIYITYDESVNHLSLPEYVNAVKPMNLKEYGINEFKDIKNKNGWEYYLGEGAKYMGDDLVNVDVRIWSDGEEAYWESVVMANTEYKSIEYAAGDLVEVLAGTTRQ